MAAQGCALRSAWPRAPPQSRRAIFPMCYGPEFAGRMLDQWAYLNGVEIDFAQPEKPTDNAYVESFDGRLWVERLNASWFLSLADARERIEDWRCHDNDDRPHTALDGLTPRAFANQAVTARELA